MSTVNVHNLPADLRAIQLETEEHARSYGLDFYETIFEVLDYDEISEIAAFGGFPTRYPHWRFGMEYQQLSKGYRYGLQKIYEMVINNDPCYAYLLRCNQLVDQKLVMAHVYGHNDFFKNNIWFSQTNRKMMDETANHGSRIRSFMERFGEDVVESFIDSCLSLENLIDVYSPHIKRRDPVNRYDFDAEDEQEEAPSKFQSKGYMDAFINPPELLKEELRKKESDRQKAKPMSFPEQPERDVLLFLLEHAPLQSWQRDVLDIIRQEAYYFAPQGQTKIMNEGWASYWHSKLMTERVADATEIVDYAENNAGVMATSQGRLNPYKLGVELYRHIEERWDKGRFGREWEECDDLDEKEHWDLRLGLGRQKIFEVRALYNDVTFIDEFLTPEFAIEQGLFSFGWSNRNGRYEVMSREFREVKEKLLAQLTNFGSPYIFVIDGNFQNRGELLLSHEHRGADLRSDYAQETMKALVRVWKRPANIVTVVEGKPARLRFDGSEFSVEHDVP